MFPPAKVSLHTVHPNCAKQDEGIVRACDSTVFENSVLALTNLIV